MAERKPQETPGTPSLQLFTFAQAAALLQVPERWLRDKVSDRAIPHTRIGRHIRFTHADLDQLIAAGSQRGIDNPRQRASA